VLRSRPAVLRFAAFEVDVANGVLRRHGQAVKLAPQPFKALVHLAARPQRLVTREELREAIWGAERTVDFEHGINTCVRQIRTALGGDAESIVETVPKLGYRFRARVTTRRDQVVRWTAAAVCGLAAALAVAAHRRSEATARVNPEAQAFCVRGRLALEQSWGPGDTPALELFEKAAAIDPQYAPAYAGISEAYRRRGWTGTLSPREAYPAALAAARRAVALAPGSSEAHVAMGDVKNFFERDWDGAEREYRWAVEADPRNATAHAQLGFWLSLRGRFAEALAEGARAQALDPLAPRALYEHAHILYYARRYDECVAAVRKALELDPGYFPAYHTLGQCYEGRGDLDLAVEAYLRSGRQSGNLGHAYAVAGRVAEAREVLAVLLRQHGGAGAGNAAGEIVFTYIGLGDHDRAFEWLDRAWAEQAWLGNLKVAPAFDAVRGDPRFVRMLQRAHLAD
jgi:tetratricopeptide (TPR) repeat protein/DNA-binding winged helix-turn-helix (wHTH) protein